MMIHTSSLLRGFGCPLAAALATSAATVTAVPAVGPASPVAGHHVVWDSPSVDHHGSMPLGNGDISLNAWVEPSGDLCFYIGKTDSWDGNGRLLKLGKIRVRLDPAPPVGPFRQELALAEGMLVVTYGDGTTLHLWADAHRPVVHLETASARPVTATATLELWRTKPETLPSAEVSDPINKAPAHLAAPIVVEPDTVLSGIDGRIGWYHRNTKSVGPAMQARIQGTADFPRPDPLLHRTFGAVVTAAGARRIHDLTLQTAPGTTPGFEIHVLTKHPATADEWLAAVDAQIADTGRTPLAARREAHLRWWRDFWSRSWINAESKVPPAIAPSNNLPLKIGANQHGGDVFQGKIRHPEPPADLTGEFTLEAEIQPKPNATGRIFDKITPGGADGFLLDMQPGNRLRLIVGPNQFFAARPPAAGVWSRVVLRAAACGWSVTIDGETAITTTSDPRDRDDAAYLSRMFALQRFITACAGRGAFPIKFNGSIFTVPAKGAPGDADYRRWGPGYWWQNTRLPYISACANGDIEILEPLFRMYVDQHLPRHLHRTRKYFGFDNAAYYPECVMFWGDVFSESYGWTPMEEREDPLQESGWHKWEWVAGPELVWMMLEAYAHNPDEALLRKRIIPTADAVIRFFDSYYKTNDDGQLVMHPAMACETWWDCTNPMPELAGLHAITARLLALPDGAVPADKRAAWRVFAAKLAPLPVRDTPSGKALAPATRFADKRNVENPELYAVFPFRLCSFERDNRELGINALTHRWDRGSSGWRQDDIFMAYLGLTAEARKSVVSRARTSDPGSRFPAFWGPNYDWIPDQDHGGVLMKATQAMLMQTDGSPIHLLPAWPPEWDVHFKLHAPGNTTVECVVRGGKVTELTVVPESRRKDVVIAPPFR